MFNRCFEVGLVKGIDIGAWDGVERNLERERERHFRVERERVSHEMKRENVFGRYIDLW